jgi:hypothetical protein
MSKQSLERFISSESMIIESTTISQTMQHENLNIDWHRKIMRSGGAMKVIDQGNIILLFHHLSICAQNIQTC